MTTLYFTPTSCGASSYIAAKYGGFKFDKCVPVDLSSHKLVGTETDFYTINPCGNVPCIAFPDKSVLNENVATLFYIAKHSPKKNLLGKSEAEEFQVLNTLSFIATEVHKGCYGLLFGGARSNNEEMKKLGEQRLKEKWEHIEKCYFKGKEPKFLVGDSFTVADAYLYVTHSWCAFIGIQNPPGANKFKEFIEKMPIIKEAKQEMDKLQADAAAGKK